MKKIKLELTLKQSESLTRMLDLAMRMHLCQFREIEWLARLHVIRNQNGEIASNVDLDALKAYLDGSARCLGFSAGSSHSIGSKIVHSDAKNAYEIMKVVQKVLAYERNPEPTFRSVAHDGLIVRYTNNPAPVALTIGE